MVYNVQLVLLGNTIESLNLTISNKNWIYLLIIIRKTISKLKILLVFIYFIIIIKETIILPDCFLGGNNEGAGFESL